MHITTKVVSLNPDCGEVYSIHYVIKLISYMYLRGCFSTGTPVSFGNKTDLHDITEILLKVALNTIKQPTKPNTIRTTWLGVNEWLLFNVRTTWLGVNEWSLFNVRTTWLGVNEWLLFNVRTTWLGVNEWLLFNVKWAIVQLYHGENKLHSIKWQVMMSTLC